MIEKLTSMDNNLIEYIGDQYSRCLYLYMDYKQYGIHNENVKVYIQKAEDKMTAVLLNYSTSLHIFSKDFNCNYEELSDFIKTNQYKAVFGEKALISNLENDLSNQYISEFGNVWQINKTDNMDTSGIESAKQNDFEEIARLIMTDDDIASSYEYNDLVKQLRERNIQKFGRNYIMRDNNKIIAHASTNAEIDNVAMVALVIVDENYRRKGIASKLMCKMSTDLWNEGKKAYLINYSEDSTLLYEKLGFSKCCEWGKLMYVTLKI